VNPQHRHDADAHPGGGQGRSRTALVAAPLGLVLVAVTAISCGAATSADKTGGETSAAHHVTYKASSTGKTVTATYTQSNSEIDGQATAASPWSMATTVTTGVAVLTVTSVGDGDSITCAILDSTTGKTLASNSVSSSTGATVTCVAGNLPA
jgi:hypothetical protein